MHISRLRRKLATIEELTDPIKTIRSSGYLFSPSPASRFSWQRLLPHSRFSER